MLFALIYYINAGNITTVKTYALTSTMEKGTLQSTNTYTYDATWKDKLATYSDGDTTYTFTYDEIGNPISYRNGMTMDWDRGRQLSSLTIGNKTVEYEYNADGLRTYKNDSTGYETIYYYDSNNNLIAIDQNSTVCYFYYDSNGEVTSMSFNGTLYFFVKNLQGDVEKIVDRQGIVQVSYTYDEWGNVISIDDDSYYTLSYFNPFLYRSYIYDRETGLYYLQSRYYDPQTGRFLNADDTAYLGATGTALSCNLFAYCENNAVNRIDSSGAVPVLITVATIGGGFLGLGLLTVTTQYLNSDKFREDFSKLVNNIIEPVKNNLKFKLLLGEASISILIAELKKLAKSIENSFAKVKSIKKYKRDYEKHHIVAQTAFRAAPARKILEELKIDINSDDNLVSIKTGLHRRLHRNIYYRTVNKFIKYAYNSAKGNEMKQKQNVIYALKILSDTLQSISNASPF